MNFLSAKKIIGKINNDYVKIWGDICNIESPTNYKQGVDRVGNYFVNLAREKGFTVEKSLQKASGDVIRIILNPDAKGKMITLSAHIDTVHKLGAFGYPPVTFKDDKIIGPGVCDCKGGAVAAFFALDVLNECGFKSNPVQFLIQTDEECGSRISNKETIKYIIEKSKDSIAFFNLEEYSTGEACLERKGIITFKLSVKGIKSHASLCAKSGANAIVEAANKIIEINKINDDKGTTCCVSLLNGGESVNTVPDCCDIFVNTRYVTENDGEIIKEKIKKIADTVYVEGCTTEFSIYSERVPMTLSEKSLALLNEVNESFKQNNLPVLVPSKRNGGSDAAYVVSSSISCIDSIGVNGGNIHTTDEFAYVDSLAEAVERLISAIFYLSRGNSNGK